MNFQTFDLNLMRVLDALLRENSTVRAAERLGLSQPAVSAALSRLRYALGDELFLRRGGGLLPTDYARSLALPLRQELDRLQALFAPAARFDPASAEGTFRISGSDFFSELLMPQLARELQRQAPGLRIQQIDLVPTNYVDSLERYHADIALLPQTEFPDWTEWRPMFHSSFAVIARKDHPAIRQAGITAGEVLPMDLFCALGHVLFSPEGRMSSQSDAALARVGRERHVVMTMPVFSGVCRAVAGSDLISVVPQQVGLHLAPELELCVFRPPMPMPVPLIVAIWHRRSSHNSAHRFLRELIGTLLARYNEGEAALPAA